MSKPKAGRSVANNEALARAKAIRTSARKLNLVAQSIRGKKAADAMVALQFTSRRIAGDVKKVLQAAIANAENNHNLDIDKLVVTEAMVGRAFVMGRFHARGRGRSSAIEKPFSNLRIVVREMAPKAKSAGKKAAVSKTKPAATDGAAGGA